MKVIREILAIGLWCAAAVQTAAYTWESFSAAGGWGSFPGLPSGSGGPNATTSVAAKAAGSQAGGIKAKLNGGVNSIINNTVGKLPIIGGIFRATDTNAGDLTTAQIKHLNSLPNPPAALNTKTLGNVLLNGSKNQQNNAINQLTKWGGSHGWSTQDIRWYVGYSLKYALDH